MIAQSKLSLTANVIISNAFDKKVRQLMFKVFIFLSFLAGIFVSYASAASNYEFHNNSREPITVVMDTCRETHYIHSGSTQVFVKANPLDQPTFRVFIGKIDECKRSVLDKSVAAKNVGADLAVIGTARARITWDGKSIDINK